MTLADNGVFTPYSTITPLITSDEEPLWAPELERERLASYLKYEELYWSNPEAFQLRGTESDPVYVPNPRTIVDTTSHFLLKGLELRPEKEGDVKLAEALRKLLKREGFIHRFQTAKHSGVVRGDWIFHILADPQKPVGSKVSLVSVDPGAYFPHYDPDNPDKLTGVDIVEPYLTDELDPKIRVQRYTYTGVGGRRRVSTETIIYELQDWYDPNRRRIWKRVIQEKLLPSYIQVIPVYHFQNQPWQGQDFGSSELRGFERVQLSINQSASDEEVALALEGLGVYATDAPAPTNSSGEEEPWSIAPGRVLQLPSSTNFDRVQGVGSIKPMQDHIKFLTDALYEASASFRPAAIDVAVAQSGIALAIKFLPTLAKMEEREPYSIDTLQQMFWDWKAWHLAYENENLGEGEIIVALGPKLPHSPTDVLNELNNMLDRKVISKQFYREEITVKLGYEFPSDIAEQIKAEAEADIELQRAKFAAQAQAQGDDPSAGKSNVQGRPRNAERSNESAGTEAK